MTEPLGYAMAVNPPLQLPPALNGFALWNAIVAVLMIVAYGYPIGQFFFMNSIPFRLSPSRGSPIRREP